MERMLSEYCGVKSGAIETIAASATVETARVGLKEGRKLAIIVNLADAASDLSLNVFQHDDVAAGVSKPLILKQSHFKKVGAETVFTKVDAEVSSIVDAGFNAAAGVVVLEISAEDLDVNGGFGYVSIDLTQPALITRAISVIHVLHETNRKSAYEQNL